MRHLWEADPFESFVADKSSGLFLPAKMKHWPTAIDLFSGAGGISLGFLQADFQVIAGVDNESIGMLTYLMNLGCPSTKIVFGEEKDRATWQRMIVKHCRSLEAKLKKEQNPEGKQWTELELDSVQRGRWGIFWRHFEELGGKMYPPLEAVFFGDARKLTGDRILSELGMKKGDLDCVAGGPPCQGFSIAGMRDVMDPRNSLVFDFCRLVLELQPNTFMFENVPGILSMVTQDGIPVMDAMSRIIADGGFGTYEGIRKMLLSTAGCGAALKGVKKPISRREANAEDE